MDRKKAVLIKIGSFFDTTSYLKCSLTVKLLSTYMYLVCGGSAFIGITAGIWIKSKEENGKNRNETASV
jgi:hypothetical protein